MNTFLIRHGYKTVYITHEELDDYDITGDYQLVITLGGDGTVLAAARKLVQLDIPVLAVNFGTIGFMTEVEKDRWKEALTFFVAGNYQCRKHMMLDVSVIRDGQVIDCGSVLNEGVLNSPDSKLLRHSVKIGDALLGKYLSDGLIVSTTTGSTAYSSAAGGPIVYPDLETVIITPICPYSYIVRPVVVTPDRKIYVSLESGSSSTILILDGQKRIMLEPEDTVVFEKSECKVRIITLPGSEARFYSRLSDRMSLRGAVYDR
ncbi:MAG: NAD(+)/NADH kinase [Spirochaetia bacterium]|nr:NAD(+)/NADH kinase [Spirochaetia bacterium]